MKIYINEIENVLDSKYIEPLKQGHMGSHILRFKNIANDRLIVKFAPKGNITAQNDFKSNIYGYNSIKKIGASELLPLELKILKISTGKAISMQDLGNSIHIENKGIIAFNLVWKCYHDLITKTSVKESGDALPSFVLETTRHLKRFAYSKEILDIINKIKKTDWNNKKGEKNSIMLLDFTPDNLFINKNKLSFIDPWHQNTYIGNPAVSIGQFATLAKLYEMKDSEKAFIFFKNKCLDEIPLLLNCNSSKTELSFKLGSTLQLILSSYVRKKSDPTRAKKLLLEAKNFWT